MGVCLAPNACVEQMPPHPGKWRHLLLVTTVAFTIHLSMAPKPCPRSNRFLSMQFCHIPALLDSNAELPQRSMSIRRGPPCHSHFSGGTWNGQSLKAFEAGDWVDRPPTFKDGVLSVRPCMIMQRPVKRWDAEDLEVRLPEWCQVWCWPCRVAHAPWTRLGLLLSGSFHLLPVSCISLPLFPSP